MARLFPLCCIMLPYALPGPMLYAGEGDGSAIPNSPSLRPGKRIEALEGGASGLVTTSSSEASPEIKQNRSSLPGGDSLSPTSVHPAAPSTNNAIGKKRQATVQENELEVCKSGPKQAKKEPRSPSPKTWFTSFMEAAAQVALNVGHDSPGMESAQAWDTMEIVLDEGATCNFLATSVICCNDGKSDAAYEYTPLHYAAAKGMLELISDLIENRNVDKDLQTREKKSTPLHMAAAGGHMDVVQFLVGDKEVSVRLQDNQGASAFHYAAAGKFGEKNKRVLAYLLERVPQGGLWCTSDSLSVLELAVYADNVPVVEYWVTKFMCAPNDVVRQQVRSALKMAEAMSERAVISHILGAYSNA